MPLAEDLLNVRIQILKRQLAALEAAAASFAPAVHTHPIADITGLQAELDALEAMIGSGGAPSSGSFALDDGTASTTGAFLIDEGAAA